MKFLLLVIAILFNISFTDAHSILPLEEEDPGKTLMMFTDLIVGRYTNTKQYTSNPENHYHMEMSICSIWENDEHVEGKWFYIEHAMFKMREKPIRQFIWNVVSIDENSVAITYYEIPNKKQYVNTCRGDINNDAFDELSKRELIKHTGCELILTRMTDGSFEGDLDELACETQEGAAKFLQTEIKISKREILLKDQGFNEGGEQVWGPTDSQKPYFFKKVAF